jgi:hypothetical protein
MNLHPNGSTNKSPLASLRRYLRPRSVHPRCELCSKELADEHDHLLEMSSLRLCCACEPCAILFSNPAAPKYSRVPRRVRFLAGFRLTDVQWAALGLPINLAFFVRRTAAGRVVALYPSPAGATEALPPPDAWDALVEENSCLRKLEPDVEALLVNRLGPQPEQYLVGIDECYALVGLVRTHWRGLSGGTAVWNEIKRFFTDLKKRAPLIKESQSPCLT